MFCPDGQYNVVAAIWFQTPEAIVRALFHDEPGICHFHPTTSIMMSTVQLEPSGSSDVDCLNWNA